MKKINNLSTTGGAYKSYLNKKSIYILKILLSLILAFIILNTVCLLYYNIPIHADCPDGSTDYKWKPNKFYSRLTEGFAYGKINNDGYSNNFNYVDDNNEIDILLMGSSHMEGFNVSMNESVAAKLNSYFGKNRVYNIGISGHGFLNCINNLENAIKKYNPKYIIIETSSITFSNNNISDIMNNQYKKQSTNSSGIIGQLQKVQLLRLLYKQFIDVFDNQEDVESINFENGDLNEKLLGELFSKIYSILASYNVKLFIMYHPSTTLDDDGSLMLSSEQENVKEFSELCEKNGIYFLDMSDRFREEYEKNYILPYGFSNTSVGTGHLNKYGHEMIADELYKLFKEVE